MEYLDRSRSLAEVRDEMAARYAVATDQHLILSMCLGGVAGVDPDREARVRYALSKVAIERDAVFNWLRTIRRELAIRGAAA